GRSLLDGILVGSHRDAEHLQYTARLVSGHRLFLLLPTSSTLPQAFLGTLAAFSTQALSARECRRFTARGMAAFAGRR
ncbi:MAG: hypothetical protein ACREJA_09135, partial [Candidatus Methylomirabilales bacterium]